MKEKKQKGVLIGIVGKVGVGKTFIGQQLASAMGYKFVKLDYQAAEAANMRGLKWLLERRIKQKIPQAHEGIQLFPLLKNLERPFSKLEFWLFKLALNRRLKKLISTGDNLIIDFVVLNKLAASRKFDKIFLIESDDNKRIQNLATRDDLTVEQTKKMERYITRYYNFEGCIKIFNDYGYMPQSIIQFSSILKK